MAFVVLVDLKVLAGKLVVVTRRPLQHPPSSQTFPPTPRDSTNPQRLLEVILARMVQKALEMIDLEFQEVEFLLLLQGIVVLWHNDLILLFE